MIQTITLKPLEHLLNRYIRWDPQTMDALNDCYGRRLRLNLAHWRFQFDMVFQGEPPVKLEPSRKAVGSPDATVDASVSALIQLLTQKDASISGMQGLALEGDIDFARRLFKIMQRMDIDWEEQLAHLTGDTVATQLGRAARGVTQTAHHTSNTLKQQLSDYLHEELAYFPSKEALDVFYEEVSELRDEVDRLEAKFDYLRHHSTL